MREKCTPAQYVIHYTNKDGEAAALRVIASSNLEAGAEFILQRPGYDMIGIGRLGNIHRTKALAGRRYFV